MDQGRCPSSCSEAPSSRSTDQEAAHFRISRRDRGQRLGAESELGKLADVLRPKQVSAEAHLHAGRLENVQAFKGLIGTRRSFSRLTAGKPRCSPCSESAKMLAMVGTANDPWRPQPPRLRDRPESHARWSARKIPPPCGLPRLDGNEPPHTTRLAWPRRPRHESLRRSIGSAPAGRMATRSHPRP
jgi:hypothetical protein